MKSLHFNSGIIFSGEDMWIVFTKHFLKELKGFLALLCPETDNF